MDLSVVRHQDRVCGVGTVLDYGGHVRFQSRATPEELLDAVLDEALTADYVRFLCWMHPDWEPWDDVCHYDSKYDTCAVRWLRVDM